MKKLAQKIVTCASKIHNKMKYKKDCYIGDEKPACIKAYQTMVVMNQFELKLILR